jgi:hypothetical protein
MHCRSFKPTRRRTEDVETVPAGDENQPNHLDPEYKGEVLFAETGQRLRSQHIALSA